MGEEAFDDLMEGLSQVLAFEGGAKTAAAGYRVSQRAAVAING